jgi:AraC family transcriptional regulator
MESVKMDETLLAELEQPRLVSGKTLLIGGIGERYNSETCAAIPSQWQKFGPHLGHVPGEVGRTAYGVLCNGDDAGNIDYICGAEVSDFSRLPADWSRLRIPEQRYVVFTHWDDISTIRRTWFTI